MKRLSNQIHLTIVAALLLFAGLVSVAFVAFPEGDEGVPGEGLAQVASTLLPPRDRPGIELTAALDRWARALRLDLSVFDEEGRPIASSGRPIVLLSPMRPRQQILHGRVVLVTLELPDGRWLAARRPRPFRRGHLAVVGLLILLAAAVAIAAWPVVRKLTGRLERLRGRVEDLGGGHLGARAAIEGNDEVAALARSFNRAAERIESLVESQRRMLAFASHELRSPLARLRLSVEMMAADPDLKARAGKDLGELEGLIDELLEASRLQARRVATEETDLLALVAEEAARTGAEVDGQPALVTGDARLLRRLVRNLLENARRYGGAMPAAATVTPIPGAGAILTVADRGPGIPASERERIFEPYYRPAGAAETGEGYGLGLALVRQIAEAHGGQVRCLDRDGGGTLFEVTLGPPPV